MIFSLWQRRIARSLVMVAGLALSLFLVSGCDPETYPVDLKYQPRTDPLVSDSLTYTPTTYDLPGEFPNQLLTLADEKDRKKILDPGMMKADQRSKLEGVLEEMFGTPLNPKVGGLENDIRQELKLEDANLAEGSRLYRIHCLHCHGLNGNGRGPTAPWVNPHPRDYRQGVFKFTSSSQSAGERKPRRDDLLRTLHEGIEGTSMPSFGLLPQKELEALASYVVHLSLRGELEYFVIKGALTEQLEEAIDKPSLSGYLSIFADRWRKAQTSLIEPGPYPQLDDEARKKSVQNGWTLFKKGDASCISCHKDYGRQTSYLYDAWGTIVRPANLTEAIYRGGRRPVDLYWRIHSGVNPSGMPAFGGTLQAAQIWDIVNFVQVLPYPKMRKQFGIDID